MIKSINHYQPQTVYFIASQETIEKIPEIKARSGLCTFKDHKILLEDINDVTGCYQKILNSTDLLEKNKVSRDAVIADFTGGTKAISSALVLVAVARGYSLTYTGGLSRDESGMGQVITGTEDFFQQVNPWAALAVEERKLASHNFNQYQFEAAKSAFNSAKYRVNQPKVKRQLEALAQIADAYNEWDRFHHSAAYNLLQQGANKISLFADTAADVEFAALSQQLSLNLEFLKSFSNSSGQFKNTCRSFILDLLANAKRRAGEGKYDDSVARLYCALGMLAQVELKTVYNLDSGKINIENGEVIKAVIDLKDDFKKKYQQKDGSLKLPLFASYQFLNALGNEIGKRYFMHKDALDKLLLSRNESILAHGIHSLDKAAYVKMWSIILDFSGIKEAELPVFPQLETGALK